MVRVLLEPVLTTFSTLHSLTVKEMGGILMLVVVSIPPRGKIF